MRLTCCRNDVQVVLKKRYNDTYKSLKNLLSGSEWYCHQAFRALNQAAGMPFVATWWRLPKFQAILISTIGSVPSLVNQFEPLACSQAISNGIWSNVLSSFPVRVFMQS